MKQPEVLGALKLATLLFYSVFMFNQLERTKFSASRDRKVNSLHGSHPLNLTTKWSSGYSVKWQLFALNYGQSIESKYWNSFQDPGCRYNSKVTKKIFQQVWMYQQNKADLAKKKLEMNGNGMEKFWELPSLWLEAFLKEKFSVNFNVRTDMKKYKIPDMSQVAANHRKINQIFGLIRFENKRKPYLKKKYISCKIHANNRFLARFLKIMEILQDSCKKIVRNVFPECCRECVDIQESYKDCLSCKILAISMFSDKSCKILARNSFLLN